MTWKTDYRAALFELIATDGVENRELLGLFEIEKRLHGKIEEFINAFNKVDRDEMDGDAKFNPLVERRHLTDLYALAHLDATVRRSNKT